MKNLNHCKLQFICNLRKKSILFLFTILPFWSFSQTFNGTGVAIPDAGAETCFNVTVSGIGVINATTGLTTVCLNATHTFDGDLDIYLVAPDGSRVELSTDNGSSDDNYTNTCFTMSAATSITAGTAPFTGNYKPEGTFSTVNNGQNANGVWKICVTDDSSTDIGSLGTWSITFGAITGGSGTTITGCTGTFYDSGGSTGDYGLSETNIVTYCPSVVGSKMTLDFTAFNTESGFDFLNIYDGTSTAATSIGNLTGNSYSVPFTVIATNTNVSGCLTFEFISDDLVVKAGWAATISCSKPCQQVLGVYTASVPATVGGYINICPGTTVTFQASGSYPQNNTGYTQSDGTSIFEWDFADGTTAIGTTVTHTFPTEGGYDIDLNIIDNNGCKSTNDIGVRVRAATEPSFVGTLASPITICQGSSATLTGVATPTPWSKPTGQTVGGTTFLPDGSGTSYSTSLVFDEFNPSATLTSVNDIVNICANLEHSYSGDLELNITCPDGTTVQLKMNDGGNVFLGEPVDDDAVLTAGDGYDYCWQMTGATYPTMTTYAAGTPATYSYTDNAGTLVPATQEYYPAGSYTPTESFIGLVGCPLNGTWTIKVTDHISSDNGYIFSWGIAFAPSLYPILWGFTPTISTQTWTGPGSPTAGNPATVIPPALGNNVYTYTVVDDYGCSHDTTVTVNVTGFTLTKSQNNVTCFAGTNGTATVTVPVGGGTPNFSYHWSGGAIPNTNNTPSRNNTVTGLAAGVYTVTVTDGGSCTNTASFTITAPAQITYSTSMTSAVCGASNGSATVGAVTGGTGAYTYAWSNSTTANPAINLAAGNYTVTVKDAVNCISTAIVTVTGSGSVTADFSINNGHQCLTGNSFTFTNTGSTGAGITYSWDFGDTQTGTGSPVSHTYTTAGSYNVVQTVTQGTCVDTKTITVYVHPHPTVTITPTPATCLNLCDGSALVAASSTPVAPPYVYAWSNSTTANPAIGLCDGVYSVTVTDNWGCEKSQSVTITEPAGITLVPSRTDANCNGQCNGTANVVASGGSSSYTYLWSNGASTANITSLCAGNYTVSVFDSNSIATCYQTVTAVVGQPTVLAATNIVAQNVSCNGGNNGSATINVTGGTLAYSYLWPASAANQIIASVTNLSEGTHIVTVTDNHGCTATTSVIISQPVLLTASATVNQHVSCKSGNDGSATITPAGGTTVYSYLWPASAANQTTATVTNLSAGTYIVTITDAKFCFTTVSVTITEPNLLTVTASGTNLSCNAVCNGTISSITTAGTSPYTYLWSNGGGTSASATNMCAGTYTITVTDLKGCKATSTVTITEPAALIANSVGTPTSCNGICNGTATVTSSGGTSGYTYLWNDPLFQTNANATGLCAGTFDVTVTDLNNCKVTSSYTVTQPSAITLTSSSGNASCGNATGTATVFASGGTGTYTYTWSNGGSTSNILSNVLAGSYVVTVTDSNSCSQSISISVNDNGSPTASATVTQQVSCFGGNNGSATVSASGGTGLGTYIYNWSPSGGTGATASSLTSGNYTVSVTDGNGCLATATVSITQPALLIATITSTVDVSCNAGNNGSATVSVSGGTTVYSYLWPASAASQTGSTANNLQANTYIVTITDFLGCKAIATTIINQPLALTASTVTNQQVSCFGGSNGSATVTASNGTPIYSYLWPISAASQTTATATNLAQGSYIVTVTDFKGCEIIAIATISEPLNLSASILVNQQVSCFGGSNGSATITATGGTVNYSYAWPASALNQNTALVSNLLAGNYIVTVTDALGCKATATTTITEPLILATSIAPPANVSCFGGNNGSATVTATGGTVNYSYAWPVAAANQNTATASNLLAGSYDVTVTDDLGCESISTALITQPLQVVASASLVANAHCGQNDGSVTVSAIGGTVTTSYSYYWSDPLNQTTQTAVNLLAGTYSVTVTDNNACTSVANVNINDIAGITSLANITVNTKCNGSCDGEISIIATGGSAPYTYLWDAAAMNQTSQTATGLCAVSYTVTVKDANNCTLDTTVIVGQPDVLEVDITPSTNVSCNGGSDGTATALVTGEISHYNYIWSTVPSQNSEEAIDLSEGAYTVSVIDANNCLATANVTITQPTPIVLNITTVPENCGRGNGSATVSASGGTPGLAPNLYTYQWYYDAACTNPIIGANQATFTGLHAGTYYVKVLDGNGCVAPIGVAIISNIPGGVASISAFNNVTCNAACNGTATVSIGGGVAPYIYSWSNGQATSIASGLCPGVFVANVTDANLCVATASVTITQPTALTNSFTFINAQCNGANSGSITANPSGGTTPYSYNWNAAAAYQTTQIASNLIAGAYSVTISDNNNCTLISSYTITEPTAIVLSAITVETNCGQNNGEINLTATGGTGPYTYAWSNFNTNQNITTLFSGSYSVTVTDAHGCKKSASYAVNNIAGPTVSISNSVNVSCNGLCDGSASIIASGNVLPLNYIWDDPMHQITQTATNLCAGTYNVTVSDPAGCIASTTVIINQPPQLTITTSYVEPSCNGGNNGTASVIALGGTPAYTYTWNGGGLNPSSTTNTGLVAGNYTISVHDANGCLSSQMVVVSQPNFMSLTTLTTNVLCSGSCDGTATVIAAGGTSGYSYIWSNGQTTATAVGLCAGNYSVTVTDSHGCTEDISLIIFQPSAISININQIQHVSCFGGNDGFIISNATGGVPNYNYLWSNGSTGQNINGLTWGSYILTVTDVNNCSVQTTIVISQPPALAVQLNSVNENCFGACDGSIACIVNGGTPTYTYQWSNLQTTNNITGLCPGTYTLIVTDSKGCTKTTQKVITGQQELSISVLNVQPTHCGMHEGSAQIGIQGGLGNVGIHWSNNGTTLTQNNLAGGLYGVTVTDQNGCTDVDQININDIDGPTLIGITSTSVNCFGQLNGSATATYTSVAAIASVVWNDPLSQASATAAGLAAGNYSVLITDINGCVVSGNVVVTQPSQLLSVISSKTNAACNGYTDGSITVTVSGGTPNYIYSWSDGQANPIAVGLGAGAYSVTVTDDKGCKTSSTAVISQPMPILINGVVTNAHCNGSSDGLISLTVQGGTPIYSYTWMPAVSTNSVAADLATNTYDVIVTDNNGCQQNAQYNVEQPAPLIVYTSTLPTTCGNPNGSAKIDSITGGNGSYHYVWSPGNFTTNSITNLAAGTYQLQVFDGQNCSVIQNVIVGVVDPPQLFSSQTTPVSCYGGNNGIAEIIVKYGTPPYSYLWAPYGGINSVATNLSSGTYTVTVADANNCLVVNTIIVSQPAQVIAHADGIATICIGQSTLITASAQGGNPDYSFIWDNNLSPIQTHVVSPILTTTYTVYATDHNGCISSPATVIVSVNPLIQANLYSPDSIICEGDSTLLIVEVIGGNGGPYSFFWIGATQNNDSIYVNPITDTQYGVVVTDGCGTPADTVYIMIGVKKAPEINIVSNVVEGCEPLTVIFNNTIDNGQYVNYVWNFGDLASGSHNISNIVNPTHDYYLVGEYSVYLTAINSDGCETTVNKPNMIHVYPLPKAEFYTNPNSAIVNVLHSNIEFIDNSSNDVEHWLWYFGDNSISILKNPVHSYSMPGIDTVLLIVENEYGCKDTASKIVNVKEVVTFYAPTAFSPGGDGINDTWYPQGVGINSEDYHMYIYDRWGEIIFQTDYYSEDPLDLKGHWNGGINNIGEVVQNATYVWLVVFKDVNSIKREYSGMVTLIK